MKHILTIIALIALTVSSFAASSVGTGGTSGTYSWLTIPIVPTGVATTTYYVTNGSTIATSTVPYFVAGTTATNIVAGWTTTTITTNVTVLWSSSSAAFTTNTTYSTNTSTTYPDLSAFNSRNIAFQMSWDGATNVQVRIAKSVTGVLYDTNAISLTTLTFTNNTFPSGIAGAFASNIAMEGFGYARIYDILVTGTLNMTNPVAYFSRKQNAP